MTKRYADYTQAELQQLSQGVMACLDSWGLNNTQIMRLLALPDSIKPRHLSGFRGGSRVLPEGAEIVARIDHIIGITDALRTTYPFSEEMRVRWLQKPHRRFKRQTPLAVMLGDDTPNGLLKVRMEVDCNYGYAISEALRKQGA